MKKLVVAIIALVSLSTHAGVCERITSDFMAKQCGIKIFADEHSDTYYGATAYLAITESKKDNIAAFVNSNSEAFYLHLEANFKELLKTADYLSVVVEENDLKRISVRGFFINENGDSIVIKIAEAYEDGFDENEYEFEAKDMGLSKNDEIASYIY